MLIIRLVMVHMCPQRTQCGQKKAPLAPVLQMYSKWARKAMTLWVHLPLVVISTITSINDAASIFVFNLQLDRLRSTTPLSPRPGLTLASRSLKIVHSLM